MTKQEITHQAFRNYCKWPYVKNIIDAERQIKKIEKSKDAEFTVYEWEDDGGSGFFKKCSAKPCPKIDAIEVLHRNIAAFEQKCAVIDAEPVTDYQVKYCRAYMQPSFSSLTPGRGYLRIMKSIIDYSETMGKSPTGNALREYLTLLYKATAQNSEAVTALIRAGMVINDKGYVVTDFGKQVLEAYGC